MQYAQAATAGDMAEINIIPLADVLLVLLIVFMVSAPAVTRTIGLTLPGETPVWPEPVPLQDVVLRIDEAGDTYRDGTLLPETALPQALAAIAASAATPEAQPRVVIDASDRADYESVARLLAATGQAGLRKVAFARASG